jgi:hypothetical protein
MSPTGQNEELSTAEALRLLADETRYRLLLGLCECDFGDDRRVDLSELLEHLSGPSGTEDGGSANDVERSAIELRHNHLPRLDDRDVIDWDAEANAIAPASTFEELRPLVELLDEHADELPGRW